MTDGQPPPRDRVAAAAAGDADALAALWREHRRWVAAILLAHMPRAEDLEDLLQDVAMTMVGRISELRSEGAFKPWLRMVAVNRARTAGRRRRTRTDAIAALAAERTETDVIHAGVNPASREEGRRLLALVRRLPEPYREPLLLRYLNEMTYRQIGDVLELPETTIETRIARARRMLREMCPESEPSPRPITASQAVPAHPGTTRGVR